MSPSKLCTAGQDRVEPALLRFAREHGADIRFSTALARFAQRDESVEAIIRDEASGEEITVLADYMIAADGAMAIVGGQTAPDFGGNPGWSQCVVRCIHAVAAVKGVIAPHSE